jgi:hypothetical protein
VSGRNSRKAIGIPKQFDCTQMDTETLCRFGAAQYRILPQPKSGCLRLPRACGFHWKTRARTDLNDISVTYSAIPGKFGQYYDLEN